jgi:hypothetical protein|tara:strand:+ start:252 stop:410 length:159 start_codon:yes stop_codon:yes gene_type:complete
MRYKTPRETLGRYLAETYHYAGWDVAYNPEQKEYWYLKADTLLLKLKAWNIT